MHQGESRTKGDERILGQGDFVESVLNADRENLDRKYGLGGTIFDGWWIA
jgi:hypothetical protein